MALSAGTLPRVQRPPCCYLLRIANSMNCFLKGVVFIHVPSWKHLERLFHAFKFAQDQFCVSYRASFGKKKKKVQLLPWNGFLESTGHGLCSARIPFQQHWRPQRATVRWGWVWWQSRALWVSCGIWVSRWSYQDKEHWWSRQWWGTKRLSCGDEAQGSELFFPFGTVLFSLALSGLKVSSCFHTNRIFLY